MLKEFSVAILTPTTGICRMAYAQSLARLVGYFAQVRVFPDLARQMLATDSVEGSGIAANYECMVTKYLNDKDTRWTHFLSIEDDMGFLPDCLHIMARRELPIVAANYSTNKGTPLRFVSGGLGKKLPTTEDSTGLEEAGLVAQGFTLVAREVYEAIPKPWFMTGYCPETGNYVYQDYYFSEQARKAGFKLYVDHDVSKRIWHVGTKHYSWQDALIDHKKEEVADNGNIPGTLRPVCELGAR